MKKNKFITSTIILIIGGFITKILGMIIKIVMTRLVNTEVIGLYMLINPTFILLISISTLSLSTSISKLISEKKYNTTNIITSSLLISIIVNITILFIILLFSKTISNNLLNDKRTYYPILSIIFVLPFISISNILRGYFFGKQKFLPHTISNIIEDITRLIIILIFTPFFIKKGIQETVSFLVISNIFSEVASTLTLLIFLPKKIKIDKQNLIPNKINIKNLLKTSIPSTGSRLIGSIGFFLEPIILTYFFNKLNYNSSYLTNEYGILNGYVLPLILLPSFFTSAISQALLPLVSENYSNKNYKYISKKINQAIFFSLLIGIPSTLIFTLIPDIPLKIIYNTEKGINYIRFLAPICLLHYIQSPLTSALQAMNKSNIALRGTLIGIILRTICLIVFCNLNLKMWSVVFSSSINIIYVTLQHIINIKKCLHINKKVRK